MNKLLRTVVYRDHGAIVGTWDPVADGLDESGVMHLAPGRLALAQYVAESKARALYDALVRTFVLPVTTAPELRWDTVEIVSGAHAQALAHQYGLRVVRHGE
jgi:hypothetical protein